MTERSLSAAPPTGNACVIKAPDLTPLSNTWFGNAGEAVGLPKGAVNILYGLGHEAGAALSANAYVNQIVFPGSVPTGVAIETAAAQNVVPCVLELGGKSAAIVHDGADLEAFEADVRWGIYFNAGQVCSAMSRVIVHESIYDELVERMVVVAQSLTVGAGHCPTRIWLNYGRDGLGSATRPCLRHGRGSRSARRTGCHRGAQVEHSGGVP